MPESNVPESGARADFLSSAILIPLAALIVLVFLVLLFPWDSLGRRLAWEISRVSGARVEVSDLAPGVSARGPVLRARDVTIEHPAVERVRLFTLEIAPRFSTSWLGGEPTIRLWAETGLGNIDGVLRLGSAPSYVGRVTGVELSRLPLRLKANDLALSGRLDADADVALDPSGTLRGRVEFESNSLRVESPLLPVPLPFTHASGVIEILETGATRISDVELHGEILEGKLAGEIGLVHRSQSPPIDMTARIRILDPTLRSLAPSTGLSLSPAGEADVRLSGTIEAPEINPATRRRSR